MDTMLHIFLLSMLTVAALEYAFNRSLIHVLMDVSKVIWEDLTKISEFVYVGCIILATVILMVVVFNILFTSSALTSKRVSDAVFIKSCGLISSSKIPKSKISKVSEAELEEISPLPNKSHKVRDSRRYFIILKDDD